MTGNNCTGKQLEAAKVFLKDFAAKTRGELPEKVVMNSDDLVRLLAWYGALRYKAAEDGYGTLEEPCSVRLLSPDYRESRRIES